MIRLLTWLIWVGIAAAGEEYVEILERYGRPSILVRYQLPANVEHAIFIWPLELVKTYTECNSTLITICMLQH